MDPLEVLAAYPGDCQPIRVEPLGAAGGFSGARFWKIQTPTAALCLRRWPEHDPAQDELEFIQAVLWHVTREGFRLVPLPRETRHRAGYVRHGGHFWELSPWMPGKADFRDNPTIEKLTAAMVALAEFHLAAATFPLPNLPRSRSPGVERRLRQLQRWMSGGLDELRRALVPDVWAELDARAHEICSLAEAVAGEILLRLDACSRFRIPLQPCIRDVWHAHVLFDGPRVTGLRDFGHVGADSVAADVARLLGSLAREDGDSWRQGLAAYQSVRPLSETELQLVEAFDLSTVLMGGLNWIDWIYRQRRVFESWNAIPERLDEMIFRLHRLDRPGPLIEL